MKNKFILTVAATAALGLAGNASALLYDANVTPDVIFGSGNANGGFTVDQASGVELGLRGKLRHNAAGNPENTFNSNGDGTYSFAAGVAPTQAFPTAVWSFEWSINTNFDGNSAWPNLGAMTYMLGIDYDPTQGTQFLEFDPIHAVNPNFGEVRWDHAIGTNATGNGGGGNFVASTTIYSGGISGTNNVAQNSWKPHWFIGPFGFDPTLDGTYDIYLAAFDTTGNQVARTDIQIIVGAGGAPVPEPATMTLLGLGLAGLAARARKGMKKS